MAEEKKHNFGHDFLVYGAILLGGLVVYQFASPDNRWIYLIGGLAMGAGLLGLIVLVIRVIYRLLQKV